MSHPAGDHPGPPQKSTQNPGWTHPNEVAMYLLLADMYYENSSFQQAAQAYEKALTIDRDNVHALNNLAWLLLTCPDTAMRDPKRALTLSARAAVPGKDAHVWDTHARALFENGRIP